MFTQDQAFAIQLSFIFGTGGVTASKPESTDFKPVMTTIETSLCMGGLNLQMHMIFITNSLLIQ